MRPHRRQPTRLPRPWILQARTLEWVAISFSILEQYLREKSSLNNVLDCYFTTMACGQITPASPDGLKCRFVGPIQTCSISVNKTSKSAFLIRAPFQISTTYHRLPWWFCGKESIYQCRRCGFNCWVRKIPWRRKRQPIPVFLPGKSHGQRSLVGSCRWGRKELDTTERLHNNNYIPYTKIEID